MIGVEVKLQVAKYLTGKRVHVIIILSAQVELILVKLVHIELKVLSDKKTTEKKNLLRLSRFIFLKHSTLYDQCRKRIIYVHVRPWLPSEGRH